MTRPKERTAHRPEEEARTFRFVHDGQEYLVLSEPLRPAPRELLTPAELDIAQAIVRGASNADIARMRGTSVRTVANQVASILGRLGASSRSQVAAKLGCVDFEQPGHADNSTNGTIDSLRGRRPRRSTMPGK
jgi:DNA-binding NarL/FixJ family response regulator